jgi:uncharacterized protein involved in exopolysaccharide biosynthesis
MTELRTEALPPRDNDGIDLLDLLMPLVQHRWLILGGALLVGVLVAAGTFLVKPTFTARASFLPPQPQQNQAASALQSLGAIAGLAGITPNLRTPADQYIALMQSNTVADRIIDQFQLMSVYEAKLRVNARKQLGANVSINAGKKDGLIVVEADDHDPQRAAAIANRFIEELRVLSERMALTEAQQRRVFFEDQLRQTRDRLAQAQRALEASGFTQGALRAEPKAAAEAYARLRAEVTGAEVRLQALRRGLNEDTPEVQQQQAVVGALRGQLARAEAAAEPEKGPDYVGKYREFKYQETLFEIFSKQFELARLDESRDGALIQVVDPATPPELKSRPKRAVLAVVATLVAGFLLSLFVVARNFWRRSAPLRAARIAHWQSSH